MSSVVEHVFNLRAQMGELLGPRPLLEIVITHYANDEIKFQFEGFGKPATPDHVYHLLSVVAGEVKRQSQTQETPHE